MTRGLEGVSDMVKVREVYLKSCQEETSDDKWTKKVFEAKMEWKDRKGDHVLDGLT